jgi:hypothetical protein
MPSKKKLPKIKLPKELETQLSPSQKIRQATGGTRGVNWVRSDSAFTKDVQLGERQKHEKELSRMKFKQDSTLLAMQLEIAKMNARAGQGRSKTPEVVRGPGGNITVVGGDPSKALKAGGSAVRAIGGKVGALGAAALSFTPWGRGAKVISAGSKLLRAVPVKALIKGAT